VVKPLRVDLGCADYVQGFSKCISSCLTPETHPGNGTLGYSLPAAIGAKLACPKQPVVSISDDGGFLFTMQELSTAAAQNLDLIALVFNDNAFGAIAKYQERMFGGREIGAALKNPDFVKLGDAFGANSLRVEAKDLGATVARASGRRIVVDRSAVRAGGFGADGAVDAVTGAVDAH